MRSVRLNLPSQWVLPISLIFLFMLLFLLEYEVMSYTNGVFVYPQDDAYLRMAIAKNLSDYGIWGLYAKEFAPASSSILYPLLLALFYKIFGPHAIIPFIINAATAVILLVVIRNWLRKQGISPAAQLAILIAVIIFTPLPIIIAIGMEHGLQLLFSFLFVYQFCNWLTVASRHTGKPSRSLPWRIFFWGLLLVATRYEGVFLILTAILFLLVKRRWLAAAVLLFFASIPVVLFGLYSMRQGGYLLPNSMLVRALPIPINLTNLQKVFTTDVINNAFFTPPSRAGVATGRLLLILPLVYYLFIDAIRQQPVYRYLLIFMTSIALFHLSFANSLFLYRYEAYLFACACPVIGVVVAKYGETIVRKKGAAIQWMSLLMLILLAVPIFLRSWQAYRDTGVSSINMYDQDYQVALFFKKYYNDVPVIGNNPGASSFLSDGKKVDIVDGIASMEVIKAKEEEYYRPLYQGYLIETQHPVIAAIDERYYSPYIYSKWKKIATWTTRNVLLFGSTHISFYALHDADADKLKRNLGEFERQLPPGVKVTYE